VSPDSDQQAFAPAEGPLHPRHIRLFVSSTFRDMQDEREILIKKIFPQLRRLCEQRSVVWSEVDLRWGITDEQVTAGHLLPLCLAEIDRCRPYFLGLLGDRYGYVPERIDPALEEQHPWLRQRGGRSLTELEILHGALNDPSAASHALFYFRDPRYAQTIALDRRPDYLAENPDAAVRLAHLKDQIRGFNRDGRLACAPRENYATPEALGAMVLEDLTKLIDRLYPVSGVPDSKTQERLEQQAFADSHTRCYVRRPSYTSRLDDYAEGDDPAPFVVLGEAGSGKTALLADWITAYQAAHPQHIVLTHFIGGTRDSANWVEMLRRIMAGIKDALALHRDVPFTTQTVRDDFPGWLRDAARKNRVVLVLDALDQLADRDGALDLAWLPRALPDGLRLVVSTLPGPPLDELERRNWGGPGHRMTVGPFTPDERRSALDTFLGHYRKTLSPLLARRLLDAPQCENPFFLRAVLDELRQFGKHDQLDQRVDYYLQAIDLTTLFERILNRWVADFSAAHDVVGECLCLIGAARRGLSEGEVVDLLGGAGTPLPRVEWTPFFLAAESALINRGGQLAFAHAHLKAAVHARWLDHRGVMSAARRRLATFFRDSTPLDDRRIDELPWLLTELQDWDGLKDLLTDIPMFLRMRKPRHRLALLHYWSTLERHCNAAASYDAALTRWMAAEPRDPGAVSNVINQIAIFHYDRHDYAAAEPLLRRGLALDETTHGPEHADVATKLTNLGELLHATGRLREAEPIMRRALGMSERAAGPEDLSDDPDIDLARRSYVATCLNNLGRLLHDTNQVAESERLLRRAVVIWERTEGRNDPKVAIALSNLALVLEETNRPTEAERALQRSLAIDEKAFGLHDPRLATTLNNLATLLRKNGQTGEAESAITRALKIDETFYGPVHTDVGRDLSTLGSLLYEAKRLEEAEPVGRRALNVCERVHGSDHPDVAIALNNLGAVLAATGRGVEAEPLLRRALDIHERRLGPDHPAVANDLNTLAALLQSIDRLVEAEPLSRRHLEILLKFSEAAGHPHRNLQVAVDNYANVLSLLGLGDADIFGKVSALTELHGVRVAPRGAATRASSAATPLSTVVPEQPAAGDGRVRPFQLVSELVDIGRADGFQPGEREGKSDANGRHARAYAIGVRLHAHGGTALMRSIFDAVRPRVGAAAASELNACWNGIGGWPAT
jgi:nephrocystin-3